MTRVQTLQIILRYLPLTRILAAFTRGVRCMCLQKGKLVMPGGIRQNMVIFFPPAIFRLRAADQDQGVFIIQHLPAGERHILQRNLNRSGQKREQRIACSEYFDLPVFCPHDEFSICEAGGFHRRQDFPVVAQSQSMQIHAAIRAFPLGYRAVFEDIDSFRNLPAGYLSPAVCPDFEKHRRFLSCKPLLQRPDRNLAG